MTNKQLFELIHEIADMALKYSSTVSRRYLEDCRENDVNPHHTQTESGLFLELYYGIPSEIWTPWGAWRCWGNGTGYWDDVMPNFLQRLGAIEVSPLCHTPMDGQLGPLYALTSVKGVALPPAVERERDKFIKREDAKAAWKRLRQQHQQ